MQDRELMQRFLANVDVLCGYAARAAEGADIDWGGVDGDIGVDIRRDMAAFRILLKQLLNLPKQPERTMKPKPDQLAAWMQEAGIDAVPVGGYYVSSNALAGLAELAYKAGVAADWRLRAQNLELVEALNKIKAHMDTDEYAWEIAASALAKATGEIND